MPTCRACGAPIRWAITAKGHAMPLDPTPVEGGNVTLTHNPTTGKDHAQVHGRSSLPLPGAAYISHHATCPNWRKARR